MILQYKNDVPKEFMMVDEYDTQSTFAYFFKILRKLNLIFIHLKIEGVWHTLMHNVASLLPETK